MFPVISQYGEFWFRTNGIFDKYNSLRKAFADEIKLIMNTPRNFIFGVNEKGRTVEKATIYNKYKISSIINDKHELIQLNSKYYKIKSYLSESAFTYFNFSEIVDIDILKYYFKMLEHLKKYAGGWVSYINYIGQPAEHPYTGNDISNYLIQYHDECKFVAFETSDGEILATGFARDLYDDINNKIRGLYSKDNATLDKILKYGYEEVGVIQY